MSLSVREQVLENIVATLQGIKVSSGYSTTVEAQNVRRTITSLASASEFPMLFVMVGPETVTTPVHDYVTCQVQVTIEAWIRGDRDTLPGALEQIVADIRTAMQVDYTRGGWAIKTDEAGVTEPVLSDGEMFRAVIGVSYTVMYRHRRTDPTQKG